MVQVRGQAGHGTGQRSSRLATGGSVLHSGGEDGNNMELFTAETQQCFSYKRNKVYKCIPNIGKILCVSSIKFSLVWLTY